MNLAQMQVALDLKVGMQMTSQAQLSYLNEAIQLTSADKDWPWLDAQDPTVATISGTSRYALPADWERTRTVNLNNRTCRYLNIADIDRYQYFDDQTTAWYYSIDQGSIVFAPPINGIYPLIHRYVKQEPMLVNPTDVPLIPSRFHYGLVTFAALLVMENRGHNGMSQVFRASWEEWHKKMLDEQLRAQSPKRIRVRNGSAY